MSKVTRRAAIGTASALALTSAVNAAEQGSGYEASAFTEFTAEDRQVQLAGEPATLGIALTEVDKPIYQFAFSFTVVSGGGDNRIFLRVGGIPAEYKGFSIANGHHHAGEWGTNGIYLGRTGWHKDAKVSGHGGVSLRKGDYKSASGLMTATHNGFPAKNTFIGWRFHGTLLNENPMDKIQLAWVGPGKLKDVKIDFI